MKSKKNAGTMISQVMMIAVGAASGFLIATLSGEQDLLLAGVLMLIGSIPLQTVFHELGHLVFGLMTGYRFAAFTVFGLTFVMQSGRLKIKRHKIAGIAGQCLMAPPEYSDGNFPAVLYNAGGAIMNFALSVLCLTLFFTLRIAPVFQLLLCVFSITGFAFAFLNGFPLTMGLVANDGKNAVSLSKNRAAKRALWLQLKVSEQTALGIRLKDMPDEWFAMPHAEDMANALVAALAVFRCSRFMDQHRFDEAGALAKEIAEGESGVLALHKSLLAMDLIFLETIGQGRADIISAYQTKQVASIMKGMRNFPSVIRTQYARALLDGDGNLADEKLRLFAKVATTYPYQGEIESERELMKIARERITAATE